MRYFVTVILFLLASPAIVRGAEDDFRPLFDGKSFAGWTGEEDLWSVHEGVIVGTTDGHQITHNTFLITEKKFKNFVLRVKFKLRNGNSGVQIRSEALDDFIVRGYQADIAEQRFMGILYEERGRGILRDVDPEEIAKHTHADDWNEYVITADGPRITQQLNGFTTVDYTETSDEGAKEGVIALQLHAGPEMRVWFKDIEIKELP